MTKYLLLLLILISTSTPAAINKWVDSNGKVHYSDEPAPVDTQSKTLRPDSKSDSAQDSGTNQTSSATAQKTIAEREADLKKAQKAKQEAADKEAKKQAIAEAQKASCAAAQQNLRTLQDGGRIVEVDAKGEHSYMDDNQREQRLEKAKKDVSAYCK